MTLLSCKKEETLAVAGLTEVEIILTNPTQDQTISGSAQLSIDGRIEANALMSGWSITITNADNGETLDEFVDRYEQTLFMIHHHWTPNVPSGRSVEIQIKALGQNDEILAEESILVNCD